MCYIFKVTMKRRRFFAVILLSALFAPILWAGTGRPRVALVFSSTEDSGYLSILQTEVESRITSPVRYRIILRRDDRDPEEVVSDLPVDAVLFLRLAPRRDGSMRVESDVWAGGSFVWSDEYEVETDDERFTVASRTVDEMVAALDGVFPAYATVEFENRGYDAPCEIFINGESYGASLVPVGLAPGTYEVLIKRRDDIFEYTVARYNLELLEDDYIRLVFGLDPVLPVVPGLRRFASVHDPWWRGIELNGGFLVPLEANGEVDQPLTTSYISILSKGLLFNANIWGIESGYTRTLPGGDSSETRATVTGIPLMIFTGFQLGPVASIDFVLRFGGGLQLSYLQLDIYDADTDSVRSAGLESIVPVARGVFEFGVRMGKRGRFSVGVQESTVIEPGGVYSWIGVQGSFGVRL